MSSWLLTWNENKFDWRDDSNDDDDYEQICKKSEKGEVIIIEWSCCSKKIKRGDEVFLIRLGKKPRGIIAHGVVIENVIQVMYIN